MKAVILKALGGVGELEMVELAQPVTDYQTQRLEDIVKEVDLLGDSVGGENFAYSLQVLKPEGMIVGLPSNKAEENRKIAGKERKFILIRCWSGRTGMYLRK